MNIFLNKKVLSLGIFVVMILGACKKADYYYKDYIIERSYVGKVDSVWIKPGENRLKIYWLNSKDLTAKKIGFYWNGSQDSVITTIDNTSDTGSLEIDKLNEGDHLFNVLSFDDKGNHSLPLEISGTVYGNLYKNALFTQGIDHVVLFEDSVSVFWNNVKVEPVLLGNEIQYTDKNQKKQTAFTPFDLLQTTIYNVDTSREVSVRSLYRPDTNALDNIYSNAISYTLSELQEAASP